MNELTQRGIEALKSGDRSTARKLLGEAIRNNHQDVQAWLWLSGAVDTDTERIKCLKQVLIIDPGNQAASRGLAKIMAAAESSPQVAKASTPVPVEAKTNPPPAEQAVVNQPIVTETTAEKTSFPHQEPDRLLPRMILDSPAGTNKQDQGAMDHGTVIFRSRPSLTLALLLFWLFFFGTIAIAYVLSDLQTFSLLFAAGLGFLLEIIVIFVIIRNLRTRYELTNLRLLVPFRGKKVYIPNSDIFHAECRQSTFQKIFGSGDLLVNTIVDNELAVVRMRDIPDCKKRLRQVDEIIQSHTFET